MLAIKKEQPSASSERKKVNILVNGLLLPEFNTIKVLIGTSPNNVSFEDTLKQLTDFAETAKLLHLTRSSPRGLLALPRDDSRGSGRGGRGSGRGDGRDGRGRGGGQGGKPPGTVQLPIKEACRRFARGHCPDGARMIHHLNLGILAANQQTRNKRARKQTVRATSAERKDTTLTKASVLKAKPPRPFPR